MKREAKPQFDPVAVAADISGVLTVLAGVTELGSRVDVRLESAEPLQSLAAEVTSRARTLAKETLEERVENVGVEDAAIEKARQPIERLPLEDSDYSTVVGSIRDVKSGQGVRGGHVVAKTPDGQVIGESAVDAMGNFAIELTGSPTEVHIEALDETGKSVSVTSVELAEDQPAAHRVEMVTSGKRRPDASITEDEGGSRVAMPLGKDKAIKSLNLSRIRRASVDYHLENQPTMRGG